MSARRGTITRAFFQRPSEALARDLLGLRLVRVLEDGTRLSGQIVETEAYVGVQDRAAHSFGGRRTPRVEAMYGPGGTAYVYFTYGMHWCFNIVAGLRDEPVAVLIRAIEPLDGLDVMRRLRAARRTGKAIRDVELCSGPARLCQALAIDGRLNGVDLTANPGVFLEPLASIPDVQVQRGPRIGVDSAGDWASAPLRFWVRDHPCVSGPRSRRSPRSGPHGA